MPRRSHHVAAGQAPYGRSFAERLIVVVDRAVYLVSQASAVVAAAITCLLALLLVAAVATRAAAGTSIPGVHEIARTLLVAVVFLGLPHAERTNTHVRVTLLTGRFQARTRAAVRAIALSAALVIVVLLVRATYHRAQESLRTQEHAFATIRVPMWPARWAIVFGLALLALTLAIKIIDNVMIATRRRPLLNVAPTAESDLQTSSSEPVGGTADVSRPKSAASIEDGKT